MSERLRITDVVRVRLRELGTVGEIEPAWSPGSVNRVVRGGGAYLEVRSDAGVTGIGPDVAADVVAAAKPHLVGADHYRHLFATLAEPPEVGPGGCMAVPTAPGLGVGIDPEVVA
ncbi:MAG: hypothetical protein OXJ62_06030 [Spirochaetaceae bacterium]|nr:hypothetical protein [Spirochaetaceae bacterium]